MLGSEFRSFEIVIYTFIVVYMNIMKTKYTEIPKTIVESCFKRFYW